MYRVSPMTYLIAGWAGISISDRVVHCAQNELAIFDPPSGQNCSTYLSQYFEMGAPGQLSNPSATSNCEYCPLTNGAQYLAGSRIYAADAWRNFGFLWVYIVFNVFATIFLYYIFRVKKLSLEGVMREPKKILAKISARKK
jgi:ABC-type multidrug transport system permease subunit